MSAVAEPLISIITPVYNGGDFLESLINSVKNEIDSISYEAKAEHIVVNDGSNDDGLTQNIINKFPHLRYVSRENRGQYVSMNEGLDIANGRFVCFVSADDLLVPGTLSTVVRFISDNPDCSGFWGKAIRIFGNGDVYEDQNILERYRFLYLYLSHIPHSSIYIKREYLLQHQFYFNTAYRYVSDFDWITRIFKTKPKMKFIDMPLIYIRIHGNQTTKTKSLEMEQEKEKVLQILKVSKFVNSTFHFFQSSYSAIYRIIFRIRNYGLSKGVDLVLYFVRHRLGIETKQD